MKNNALKINRSKTDFIVFGSKIDHQTLPPLTTCTDIIQLSETIKILGVTLDSQMNMQKDIAGTCRSVYIHIRKVNSIRRYLTKDATKLLINSKVLTRLDYCNVGLPQTSTHKLQLAENAAARVISRTPRHQHITPILNELNWLPVTNRCQLKILVLTFKVLQGQAPTYICEIFQWYTPARPLRSSSTTSLVPYRNKTVRYGKRLVDTSTAALWNSLPNNIKWSGTEAKRAACTYNDHTEIILQYVGKELCSADMLKALLQLLNLNHTHLEHLEDMSDDVMFNVLSSPGCASL